ncbi:orotate phosphoribosyltransferase [Amphiplicatus metriothermophilus]|uniref:Orotate phosphoribosyltransferase n=1 Tax=Amphiplicatus metriothermophilus TaxID=1519374 RepID=A0A239PP38_9PROT|nr:orotate phosphoribosyltransferase [Amphiplicatus metriothermophilus]MBB5518774.1 orotate phosphoribosyltransferase [Amphiplicatus metriothermophilus]SNT72071.1 orotate phosphoribosyltransferase [Amphiplicatus metriothermophilus]
MKTADVLKEFEEAGALQKGHFVLSSGLHSDTYLNKSIVSMHPPRTEKLCRALAEKIRGAFGSDVDYVVSPAMGAIIYGYETARHLGVPFMFVERVEGRFELRRGFSLEKGARVAVVEDIVSTGLSARECIEAVRALGAEVIGLGCLIDRSDGTADVGAPLVALAALNVEAWPADALPDHLKAIPAVKPGSRGVSQ